MASSKDELRARLLAIFREEAADHLRAIGADVATLEREEPPPEGRGPVLERLFRTAHTLKGAARSLSVRRVEQLCHEMEDVCSAGRAGGPVDARTLRGLADALAEAAREAIAGQAAMLGGAPAGPPRAEMAGVVEVRPPPALAVPTVAAPAPEAREPLPVPSAPPSRPARARLKAPPKPAEPAPAEPRFVRLDLGHLQRLGVKAEELNVPRLSARARVDEARALVARLGALRAEGGARAGAPAGAPASRALREAEQAARHLLANLAEHARVLNATGEGLADDLRQARMMRVSEMLAVFPAMVADLAAETGRQVVWQTAGTDLLIDREIADLIKDPLIQMVRNAIDHGIEPPAARVRAGKPEAGTLSLAVEPAEGGQVAFALRDDGAGIDVPALREAAVRNRLAERERMASLSDEAVIEMAFEPSVSTRSVISEVSGRGLGLAIVRERMERLGGAVRIVSTPGAGTAVEIEVPAALADFHGIAVRCGAQLAIWPRSAVERTLALTEEACESALARGMLALEGEALAFADLGQMLGCPAADPASRGPLRAALLVRHGERRGVVLVDEVCGACEVIVKEFRPPLLRVRYALAAGLLGNGGLGLIVRPADVLDTLRAGAHRAAPPARRRARQRVPRLLVADDSITTRAMEVGLLEAAGYEVVAASDGLEAWNALQAGEFDAVISDVDMPNMDGFELTRKLRADPRLNKLPIVLVTALEDREDHERGLRLGANAYMMKSAFDQSMLIDLVRRVI